MTQRLLDAGAQSSLDKANITNIAEEGLLNTVRSVLAGQDPQSEAGTKKVIRLLIVDDNPDDREFIIRRLKKMRLVKFQFEEAGSGDEAFRIMADRQPSCVLLDYSMPGHDGLQVLSKMVEGYPFMPIIILTGQGNEAIATQAIKKGAQHYLVKSTLTTEVLDSAIASALEHKELESKIALRDQHISQYQQSVLESRERLNLVLAATPRCNLGL